jgi:threonine dehydrogenase-like Zn-dependent dehydrogenase
MSSTRSIAFDRSLAILRSGRVRTDALITHRFTSEEYDAARARRNRLH